MQISHGERQSVVNIGNEENNPNGKYCLKTFSFLRIAYNHENRTENILQKTNVI